MLARRRKSRYFGRVAGKNAPVLFDIRRWGAFAASLAAIVLLLFLSSSCGSLQGPAATRWPSVLPPLIAVLLSVCFRRVVFAMTSALVTGAFLAYGPAPWVALPEGFRTLIWENLSSELNLYILAFTFSLMGMVQVMRRSGAIQGLMEVILKAAQGARSTRIVTAAMGMAIFFDDYASSVIVGATMRSAAQRRGVSREKLAYLIDSTAAPIAGLAVISTWIAFEVGLLTDIAEHLGIGMHGYEMFFAIYPFRFYCFTALLFVFANTVLNRDFGPMYESELRAARRDKSNDEGGALPLDPIADDIQNLAVSGKIWINAVLPVATVIGGFLTGVLVSGRGAVEAAGLPLSPFDLEVWKIGFSALGDEGASSSRILFCSSASASLVAIVLPVGQRILTLREAASAWLQAIPAMRPAVTILVLAWAIKTLCTEALHTDLYLISVLGDYLALEWLPLFTFLTAAGISFATGTSWGTMGILLPVALPLAHGMGAWGEGSVILWLTAGAVLDGAIFGDHCSPISDTTVLSSIASGCEHFDHVWTQAPYAIVCMLLAGCIGYAGTVFGLPLAAAYFLLGLGTVGIFWTAGKPLPKL
jgi:Na+/H+ antiporter NhaC